MKGWGRVIFLLAVGVFVGSGCGGRTSALDGDYGPDGSGADGSGANGNGANGQGGSGPRPSGGSRPTAGQPATGGGPSYGGTIGIGGTGVYPAGAAFGGYPVAGGYPTGGAYAYGGAYPMGGYPVGGFGYGGNPNQPGGACCDAQMGPGCTPRVVSRCVCNAAPYCCDKLWDEGCASLVEPLGCGYCEREDCQSCVNRYCGYELGACYQDFGCLSIFSCMQETGCEPFQCYTEGNCRGLIDQWGGPASYSMSLLLSAFTCAIQSGCPCN